MSERIIITAPGEGVAVGGRFDGWRMRQHPDGQWMSVARLEAVDPFAKAEGVLGMLFAEHRAKSDATPTPAGAGDLVERLRDASDDPYFQMTPGVEEWLKRNWALREAAASRIEALEAEVARLRMAVRNDTATIGKYEEHRQKLHAARTTAEAERDAWRERESETQEALQKIGEEFGIHGGEPRVDGLLRVLREQRTDLAALKAEVERKNKALREAGEAIAEYFRYLHGGETRGSYDGKPEREGLRKAGYAVSRALAPAKAGG